MTQEKFTPGPWQADGNMIRATETLDDVAVASRKHNPYIGGVTVFGEEMEANAQLIAAAPDLYRELQHLVRLMEPLEKEGGLDIPGLATLNGARKALAKATLTTQSTQP